MRKYVLAHGSKRAVVDLRDYKDVIICAVLEFAPDATVTVNKDCYIVDKQLSQSQAVKIGRKICESDLSQHCIKLSKLFNSKEVTDNDNSKQKQTGGHH